MEGYGSPYGQYPTMPLGQPDHGDNVDYYNMQPLNNRDYTSSPKHRFSRRDRRSRSASGSRSRSKSRTSRPRTRSRSRSRSGSRSRSRSHSTLTRNRRPLRDPSFLDAFRVLYLTPSNRTKKSTSKYLKTKKRQDHVEEILKSDGLGSKRWLFYPRASTTTSEPVAGKVPGARDNSDQRIKIDGKFFRKYKKGKSIPHDAPIAKLMRWELMFYKNLGFVRTD